MVFALTGKKSGLQCPRAHHYLTPQQPGAQFYEFSVTENRKSLVQFRTGRENSLFATMTKPGVKIVFQPNYDYQSTNHGGHMYTCQSYRLQRNYRLITLYLLQNTTKVQQQNKLYPNQKRTLQCSLYANARMCRVHFYQPETYKNCLRNVLSS